MPATPNAWRGWLMSRVADVNEDGLLDLLAIGPLENKLWVYRQRNSGFPATPDQAIDLPAQTAWLAVCDVEAHPGLELLLSTARGLSYLRQNGGAFESQPRDLVQESQVFTNDTPARLLSLQTLTNAASPVLPVISASQAILYARNRAGEWAPGPPLTLHEKKTEWSIDRGSEWSMGSTRPRGLGIRRSFLVSPAEEPWKKAEEEAVAKILIDKERPRRVDDLDINGDGRPDLVLWRLKGDLDPKTDILVFLRGANNRLPQQPTQILHCRGLPVRVGHNPEGSPALPRSSPVCALTSKRGCELVLATPRTTITSASGLVDLVLSGSLAMTLTIRTFQHGLFSTSPDASVHVTTMVPTEVGMDDLFLIDGDFNGDGRTDVLVQRSPTRWDVVFSSARGWFADRPGASFEIPAEGNFVIQDLNSDRLSDLVVQAWEEPTLFIFLSQSGSAKPRSRGAK
jgi:hypothetical protein